MDSRVAIGRLIGAVLLAALMLTGIAVLDQRADAAAGDDPSFVPHPSLVPSTPETGYPIISDLPETISFEGGNCGGGCLERRQTSVVDMIDDYIISGGDFVDIELQDGTMVNQPWLAIVDSTTKQLVCTDLDVNNEVLAIAPGPLPNTAIIGGRFTSINGADGVDRWKVRLAMIHLDTCEVNSTWSAGNVDARVTELAVHGDRLFVGGDFTTIGGQPIGVLAELSHATGAIDTDLSFNFTGNLGRRIVGMEVNPAGTRLGIVHRATAIDGNAMRGTAIFDISDTDLPLLTPHRMQTGTKAYDLYYDIQDGAIDPDFTMLVIAQGTATVSDYVTAVPTAEAADQFLWQKFMRDSSFSIAASNNAIYVGGHFCKIDEGPGATDVMAPNSGPSTCTGVNFAGGAWRTQLAALSPADGTPLLWNPGNDAQVGANSIAVVSRGLLVGFDGDRTDYIRTGTTAFFDFGAPEDPRANQTCAATHDGNGNVTLTWNAVEGGVDGDSYVVRRNTKWVASPGDVTTYVDQPPNGVHTYFIRTKLDGVTWDTQCAPDVTVAVQTPAQTCTATANADGTTTLVWAEISGEDTYIVRRDGAWLADAGAALTFTDPAQGGAYLIRSKMAGVTTDTTCVDDGDPPDPPEQTCTSTENPDGSVTLTWTAIEGENKYIVRRNGLWLANAGDALTYVDPDASPGDTYVIRSKMNGVTTNTDC